MEDPRRTNAPPRSSAVVRALAALDDAGHVPATDLPDLREAVERLRAADPTHPAEVFGPWSELSPRARRCFREIVERDIARHMDLWPHGDLWTGAVRAARTLDRTLTERGIGGWRRQRAVRVAEHLRGVPAALMRRARTAKHRRRWARGVLVGPAELLTALGREPEWLIGDFVEGIHVDPRARGFYDDPGRNVVHGYHLSLDFIPTDDGMVLSEINLQPGAILPGLDRRFGDALGEGLVAEALRLGMRRIHLMAVHRLAAPDWILDQLHGAARREGLAVEVFEDPCMPPRRTRPPGGIPGRWPYRHAPPPGTLVVRRNDFDVGSDHLLDHKAALARGLGAVLERRGERRVRILRTTREPGPVSLPEHPGLPNLVYKYPEAMAGKGIHFMRVRTAEEAVRLARELDAGRRDGPGFFQSFVACTLDEGRVQDYRVWAFLSPRGMRYFAVVRSRQATPVPDRVPEGLVESESGVFIPKRAFGGYEADLEPGTHDRLREATRIVGDALVEMLERTFVTKPR